MIDLTHIRSWGTRVRPAAIVALLSCSASLAAQAETASVHANVTADDIAVNLLIFLLSTFLGLGLIHGVAKLLHTPLMAVTNAISSVIVVGALLAVGISTSGLATSFGFVALVLVSVNIFGGFLVTQRMLAMYKKKDK